MNVSDMRYWAFLMKNKTTKLVPFSDIKEVFILHPTPLGDKPQYNLSGMPKMQSFQFASVSDEDIHRTNYHCNVPLQRGLTDADLGYTSMTNPVKVAMGEEIYDMVNPQQVAETYPLEKPERFNKRKSRKKKDSSTNHVTVTAEQRYANKLAREAVVRQSITVDEPGYDNSVFLVKMHVRGSQYLLVDQNTGKEYWGKWKMSTDEWSFWRDDYSEISISLKGNKNAAGSHRSGCCFTLTKHRYAKQPFCEACEKDTPIARTNRRIANGGPESNLIFNKDGSLTQLWTDKEKRRLEEIKERERREKEDFE